VESQDACWARFFRANGLTPLVVVYEELEKAYAETLHATLEFIGIKADHSRVLPPPIRRQRNDTSEDYAQAYLRDRAIRGADEPGQLSHDSSWS
jgi:LPS sulfotransferase NodH